MKVVISNEGLVALGNAVSLGKFSDAIGKKPILRDEAWWGNIMDREHSTLEYSQIYIFDEACRRDVALHIVRHTKGHPRFTIQSARPDWTGKERPPHDTPCEFMSMWSPISLIYAARQRLCAGTAFAPTRQWFLDVKKEIGKINAPFAKVLASRLVPDCEYRGNRCFQGKKSCGRFDEEM